MSLALGMPTGVAAHLIPPSQVAYSGLSLHPKLGAIGPDSAGVEINHNPADRFPKVLSAIIAADLAHFASLGGQVNRLFPEVIVKRFGLSIMFPQRHTATVVKRGKPKRLTPNKFDLDQL